IRYEGSTITCHKSRQDPVQTKRPGQTVMWRDLRLPEQELLGAQYVSVVKDDAALVAANAGHWFWQAAGVGEGEAIPGLVGGEAGPGAVSAKAKPVVKRVGRKVKHTLKRS